MPIKALIPIFFYPKEMRFLVFFAIGAISANSIYDQVLSICFVPKFLDFTIFQTLHSPQFKINGLMEYLPDLDEIGAKATALGESAVNEPGSIAIPFGAGLNNILDSDMNYFTSRRIATFDIRNNA